MSAKSSKSLTSRSATKPATQPAVRPLLADLRELILQAREGVARAVDSGLVTLYWHVGRRIRQDILKEKRAGYGEKIVATLSQQLEKEFGRGFTDKNLHRMVQFAEVFPESKIVVTLSRLLIIGAILTGWTVLVGRQWTRDATVGSGVVRRRLAITSNFGASYSK